MGSIDCEGINFNVEGNESELGNLLDGDSEHDSTLKLMPSQSIEPTHRVLTNHDNV